MDLITIILVGPLQYYYDNKSTIDIAHNSIQHDRIKHVKVCWGWQTLHQGEIGWWCYLQSGQYHTITTGTAGIFHTGYWAGTDKPSEVPDQILLCTGYTGIFFLTVSTGIFIYFSYIICAPFVKIGNKLANIITKGVFHTIWSKLGNVQCLPINLGEVFFFFFF